MQLPASMMEAAKRHPVPNGRLYTVSSLKDDDALVTAFVSKTKSKHSPLRRWLLSWGSDAIVLQPLSLANTMLKEASDMTANYNEDPVDQQKMTRYGRIVQLVFIAAAKGYLTFADINFCIPDKGLTSEKMESYLAFLRGMDIEIVEGKFMESKETDS
jgi:hypothetical protein